MYTLDLLLTKSCNQKCYYCNVYPETCFKDSQPEVDIDFLKYSLSLFDFNFNVIIGGGEPALVSNINDVYKTLIQNTKIKNIRLLSNGLARKNKLYFIEYVDYYEHNIFDIQQKEILKFNDLDIEFSGYDSKNWKHVIVCTENVVTSILQNFEYFKDLGMLSDKFWYKIMNNKTHSSLKFMKKVEEFYKKLKRENELYGIYDTQENVLKRKMCSKYPYMTSIDFESKKLLHCNANSIICERYDVTKENIDASINGNLFPYSSYCEGCYVFNNDIVNHIIKGKKC